MSEFVICINNETNQASLIVGKVYRRLPDSEAEMHNMFRIVDEDITEPDGYLYPVLLTDVTHISISATHYMQLYLLVLIISFLKQSDLDYVLSLNTQA